MQTTQVTYSYDNADRLVSVVVDTGESVRCEYDQAGNRLTHTGTRPPRSGVD